jgi:hypothetical protein
MCSAPWIQNVKSLVRLTASGRRNSHYRKMWLRGTTHTTVVVNDTSYHLELHEKTNGGSKKLEVLEPKPQVKEGNINEEPTGESNSFEVKITDKTDESYRVLAKKHHQPLSQLSIPRFDLTSNNQISIRYDEKKGSLYRGDPSCNKNLDIHGTPDSKTSCQKKQKPNDPNGEHLAKQVANYVRHSGRTQRQLFPDPENSQHMVNTYNKKFSNVVGLGFVHLNKCMTIPTLLI